MKNNHDLAITKWLDLFSHLWVLPVVYYFYTIARFATNTPYGGDDIDLIIGNTAKFLSAPDIWSALPYLFTQSAEYQTFFITLSGIISVWLFGYINFYLITFVGNFLLFCGIFLFIYKLAKNTQEFNILAVIAFLLLGVPVGDCAIWANCTIGHFDSIFVGSVVSLFLIRQGIRYFILFEIGVLCTVLVNGNGIVILPMGFLGIWLFQNEKIKKRLLLIHAIICTSILVFWVITFDRSIFSMMSGVASVGLQTPLQSLCMIILWCIAWFGSWATIDDRLPIAFAIGAMEISIIIYLIITFGKKLCTFYPHATMLSLYLILTIAGASVLRSYGVISIQLVFQDRFKIYSICMAICLLSILFCLIRDNLLIPDRKKIHWHYFASIFLVCSIFHWIAGNKEQQQFLTAFKNQQLKCAAEWEQNTIAKSCQWHGYNKTLMDKATEMKIFYLDRNGADPLLCNTNSSYSKYCWK